MIKKSERIIFSTRLLHKKPLRELVNEHVYVKKKSLKCFWVSTIDGWLDCTVASVKATLLYMQYREVF